MSDRPYWKRLLEIADGTRSRTACAKLLGINRRYLHDIVSRAEARHGVKFKFVHYSGGVRRFRPDSNAMRIIPLADGTRTRKEIAEILGLTVQQVDAAADNARCYHKVKIVFKPADRTRDGSIWKRVAATADGTLTTAQVAEKLGLTRKAVDSAKRTAEEHGVIIPFRRGRPAPRKPRPAWEKECDRGTLQIGRGTVGTLIRSLPEEVGTWLAGQTPEGSTMADVIRAIITDAYHEEKGDE